MTQRYPHIDPRIIHRRPSWLRKLNGDVLRELPSVTVIRVKDDPVAVLMPYDTFLAIQEQAMEVK